MPAAFETFWMGSLGSFLAGLGTGVGGLGIYLLKRPSARAEDGMLSAAAGIMLAATFFSLLLPALGQADELTTNRVLAVGIVALGVLAGAFHPFSGVLLCLLPWPVVFFFASLGLLLSVRQTVMRANLIMGLVLVMFLFTASTTSVAHVAYSWWSPPRSDAILLAIVMSLAYLLAAWCCWRMAVFLFEQGAPQE